MIAYLLLLGLQAVAAAGPSTPPPDKIVCKMEMQPNSRIPERVCLMQSEWARIAKENGDDWASSRNERAVGRSGTIANDPEGFVGGIGATGTTARGISTRPPR